MRSSKDSLVIIFSDYQVGPYAIGPQEVEISYEEIKSWLTDNCVIIDDKDVENYLNKAFVNIMLGDGEDERN